jgi:hypothetical protein
MSESVEVLSDSSEFVNVGARLAPLPSAVDDIDPRELGLPMPKFAHTWPSKIIWSGRRSAIASCSDCSLASVKAIGWR